MSTPNKNLGVSKTVAIYLEGAKLGRDYQFIKNFEDGTTYVEGTDSYLGQEDERPWQIPIGATGSFDIDELDAKYADELDLAIQAVEATGQQPSIVITKVTRSNSGVVSKVKYVNVTIQPKTSAGGRTEKATRKYTWRSSKPRIGS